MLSSPNCDQRHLCDWVKNLVVVRVNGGHSKRRGPEAAAPFETVVGLDRGTLATIMETVFLLNILENKHHVSGCLLVSFFTCYEC